MEKDDKQLVSDYLNDDELALKELIERYLSPVYNFVFRFGGGRDSEDITQEVFVKLWKNLKKYDSEQNFKTWLFAIARNTTIDWMRKKRNVIFSDFETDDGQNFFEDNLVDPEPLPDELLVISQNKKMIEKIMEELPMNYRTILLLHYNENFTFREIGEILDKSTNTVKSWHQRALIQLKKILEKNIKTKS